MMLMDIIKFYFNLNCYIDFAAKNRLFKKVAKNKIMEENLNNAVFSIYTFFYNNIL